MGLFVIAQEVLGVEVRIHIEHRQESRYFDIRPLAQTGSRRGCHLLKDAGEVVSILEIPYEGEVWDFETENHWFNGGIGCLVAHNTGPRRHDVFVESNFAKQIAMIEAGIIPPVVRHGNLDSLRTWADVRDAVRAYYLLLTYDPQPGAFYNIGGEFSCTVGEMLTTLLRKSTLFGIEQQLDPSRLRPIDADLQVPSTQKFKDHTGWRPEIPFAKTMQDLLDYWRVRVANNDAVLRR